MRRVCQTPRPCPTPAGWCHAGGAASTFMDMPRPIPTVTLVGGHVRLEPLSVDHAAALTAAANEDRSTYGLTPVPNDVPTMQAYIAHLLDDRANSRGLPFAQIAVATGEPVGCTRYLDPHWWRAKDAPDEVEIGGTWLARSAQQTAINTEAKLLLLEHAFDEFGVWRVQVCTDARNERSRTAIERIGATFEGVLRNHRVRHDAPEPAPRQTAVYSIVEDEWPAVRTALRQKLDR